MTGRAPHGDSSAAREPHDKRTIDRAVNVLDDHDYASLGREVRRLQADHVRLREELDRSRANTDRDPSSIYYEARIYREALTRIANAPASADTSMMRSTARDALEGVEQG